MKGNSLKERIAKSGRLDWYLLFASVMFAGFLAANALFSGKFFNSMMMGTRYQLNDYFSHLGYASQPIGTNIYVYSRDVVFPPLAYLFYGFLARIDGFIAPNPTDIFANMTVGQNLTVFVTVMMLCTLLLVYAVSLYLQPGRFRGQVLFPGLLIVSYPFLFSSVQRGNSVLLISLLLCIAMAFKDSESKVKKEIALILIAVCAGFKIYPAVFGLLYVFEQRYQESVRLIIYGILFFFVPFLFYGGVDAFMTFVHNAADLGGETFSYSVSRIGDDLGILLTGEPVPVFSNLLQQAFLLLSLIALYFSKKPWVKILLLGALMGLYVSSGWPYNSVYMLPGFLLFLSSGETLHGFQETASFALYCLTFCVPFVFAWLGGHVICYAVFLQWGLNAFFTLKEEIAAAKTGSKRPESV